MICPYRISSAMCCKLMIFWTWSLVSKVCGLELEILWHPNWFLGILCGFLILPLMPGNDLCWRYNERTGPWIDPCEALQVFYDWRRLISHIDPQFPMRAHRCTLRWWDQYVAQLNFCRWEILGGFAHSSYNDEVAWNGVGRNLIKLAACKTAWP